MIDKFPTLFSPLKIGTMEVRNRIVMSPMTTDLAEKDGTPTDRYIDYLEARAAGGVGLIITEDTSIGPSYSRHTLQISHDRMIPKWKELVERVHKHGCLIAPQLIHPTFNARASINNGDKPVASSPHASRICGELCHELTVEEIEHLVDRFVEDAVRAKEVGCDAVMLHCAHNHHLLGSFLSPLSNKRFDQYGGDFFGRAKLVLDVVRRVRDAVGPDFPILTRISGREQEPGGRTIEESMMFAPMLVEAGVNAIQISTATLGSLPFRTTPPMGTPFAPNADDANLIRTVVDVPVICGTRITNPYVAEDVLQKNQADFVGMGRALLADPAFANKAHNGDIEDIIPCWGCLHCLAMATNDMPVACSSNPDIGYEKEMQLTPTVAPKKVMVVGGGCAGLTAAHIAKKRGHDVTLYDKTNKLGGQLYIASVAPLKQETSLLIKYLVTQVNKSGVKVVMNTEVTGDIIKTEKPDIVIDATGGIPISPGSIKGIDNDNVIQAWDVLAGKAMPGQHSVVIGGGQVGSETADFLTHPVFDMHPFGKRVTLIEMVHNIALKERTSARSLLVQRLLEKNVEIITSAKVVEFGDDFVSYEADGEIKTITNVDSVVMGMGTKPNTALKELLKQIDIESYSVGDVNEPRQAGHAIEEAARVALKI
jgi:2,4-dienoyl-CoA reductase-like NADH-dependent reductase (Old Yellow Enzyme family)/thioredoxin reductase